jgi:hypothetical protein
MELLPQPQGPSADISVNFIVGLLESYWKCNTNPCNPILIVVNQYTKQAHYFPCNDSLDVISLAEILTKKFILRGKSVPHSVMSDHGPVYLKVLGGILRPPMDQPLVQYCIPSANCQTDRAAKQDF